VSLVPVVAPPTSEYVAVPVAPVVIGAIVVVAE